MNSLDLKLIGSTLYFIDISISKILLTTYEGDVLELDMKDAENIDSRRINNIVKIDGVVNTFSVIMKWIAH